MGWLFGMVLLPGLVIGFCFLATLYLQGARQLEHGALQTARALSQVFDGVLAGRQIRLEALAQSPHLAAGDLAAFQRECVAALGQDSASGAIALIDHRDRQLMNTLLPYGAPLPPSAATGLVARTLASGRATVSDIYVGTIRPLPIIALAIPIPQAPQWPAVLLHGQPAAELRQFLARQQLPVGWNATLLDNAGAVIAYSGTAPGAGRAAQADSKTGGATADADYFQADSRSPRSGWTVVLRMQRSVLLTDLHRELAWIGAGIGAALLAGAVMAWRFNRGTLRSLSELRRAAARAADGHRGVRVAPGGPREIAELAQQFNQMLAARESADRRLQLAASVFGSAAEGIVLADPALRIIDANPAFVAMSGYERTALIGQPTSILQSGLQDRAYYQHMWQVIAEKGHWQGQLWDRRQDGTLFAAQLTITQVRDRYGEVSHYIALFADITEQRRQQEEIERVAHIDPLTQLPNRRLLADRLQQSLARSARTGCTLAVGAIDLDGFKQVNDELGHEAGDAVLVEVAVRLLRVVRANDTVARLGGDEFLLLLPDLDPAQPGLAEEIVQRALAAVREPILLRDGKRALVSASIGLASYPHDGSDADSLLRASDAAMYESKRLGRDQFRRARMA